MARPVVLIGTYSGSLGGAERALVQFASTLPAACHLACPEGPLADAARAGGLTVFTLRGHGLRLRGGLRQRALAAAGLAAHSREIRRLVYNLEPDLVVAWGMRSGLACLLGPRLGCPVAFQHHDLLPGPAVGELVRAAAIRADVVTTPSRTVAEDLDPGGRLHGRLHVVHPAVDGDRGGARARSRDASSAEVLVLGALTPWKRPDLALEACALARRRCPGLRLRFVGSPFSEDGDEFVGTLRERAAMPDLAGAVTFVGAVDDAGEELARAGCLLHCAPREPFGLAVLEALAAGVPAVVPAAAGPAEIADPSCALLYPPGDARAAADALVRVASDPELTARIGAAGRARARAAFSPARAQAAWEAVLAPLMNGRSSVADAGEARAPGRAGAVARAPTGGGTVPPTPALVTVTHNSAPWLRALLISAERHLPDARVVVVDCASSDDTLAIAHSFASAVTVALPDNVGFGRGCNRGLAEVHEPVTVLVNPDVELLDDSLLGLAGEAGRGGRLLAPLVLSADGSRQDTVHPAPASVADLARALVPPRLVPGRLSYPIAPWRAAAPRRVGWAVGCALVARTDELRRLGPFDERIFLYGEDLELGLRAAAGGVETWFTPSTRVLHRRAHASDVAFGGEPFELLARARHEVVAARLGAGRARLDDAAQAATFASRMALKRLLGKRAARERRQLEAVLALRRASAA
jgi:glycosyltransferase involved in cell wall biosynthesis/GT2 family glycosyltransferase